MPAVPTPPPQTPPRTRPICAGPGCINSRRRGQLMCSRCWKAVPYDVRREVYAAYRPNAGIHQNAEWLAAAQRAIESLRTKP